MTTLSNTLYRLDGDLSFNPTPPPGVAERIQTVLSWIQWLGIVAVVLGLIFGAIALAISNSRGQGSEHVKSLGFVVLGGIIIASATTLAKMAMGA